MKISFLSKGAFYRRAQRQHHDTGHQQLDTQHHANRKRSRERKAHEEQHAEDNGDYSVKHEPTLALFNRERCDEFQQAVSEEDEEFESGGIESAENATEGESPAPGAAAE